MFTLEVEYLLGRSFAGEYGRRSRPEWPPHPGRLFSALASAYFENGKDQQEKEALEWLERQTPPALRAGDAGSAAVPIAYVPTNYVGDGPPVTRGKQPRFFPAQGPSDVVVHFIWPGTPSAEIAGTLDRLASRTAYLGKSCSMIRMRVADTPPEPNYVPSEVGASVLRVPSKGRLEELGKLFEADLRPTAGAQHPYRRTDSQETAENRPVASCFGAMAVFRKAKGPSLPIEAVLTLADAVRQALLSNAGSGGAMIELIHGHSGGVHCAIAALPFVAGEHADGHLMGFAVILPREIRVEDRMQVMRACHGIESRGVHIPNVGDWAVEAEEESAMSQTLRPGTWSRPAKVWRSVTPVLLDRFPKKKGPAVEEIVGESCRRIGLPEPIAVDHGPYAALKGVPPAGAFRLRRSKEEPARWAVHVRVEFGESVQGPVLLGAGRYFGMGLMRPERDGYGQN